MDILKSTDYFLMSPGTSAVTLGNFDGVHLGHRELFRSLVRTARRLNCSSVVYTFDPHPLKFLAPNSAPLLLNTPEEKQRLIAASHVDYLIETPFTADFAKMSPEEFVTGILLEKLHIKALIVGYDYAFGRGRGGNTNFLKACGERYGFSVEVLQPVVMMVFHTVQLEFDKWLQLVMSLVLLGCWVVSIILRGLLFLVISVVGDWDSQPQILKLRKNNYLPPVFML